MMIALVFLSRQAKGYMRKPPFSGLLTDTSLKILHMRPEAMYLYDAVLLYSRALNSIIRSAMSYLDIYMF